jgi:putative tryptophan/tyrosine transport system substrate-binding protein
MIKFSPFNAAEIYSMIRRREFIGGLGAATWPLAARAQKQTLPVIGVLSFDPISQNSPTWLEFRRGLAESGFFEGQNITFEFRVAGGNIGLLAIAENLLAQNPAVVLAIGSGFVPYLKAATSTLPIVFISGLDPVSYRFVDSVARPGGNVTGINFISTELIGKRIDLLLELIPQAKIIGNLSPPENTEFFKEWTTKTLEAAKAR